MYQDSVAIGDGHDALREQAAVLSGSVKHWYRPVATLMFEDAEGQAYYIGGQHSGG